VQVAPAGEILDLHPAGGTDDIEAGRRKRLVQKDLAIRVQQTTRRDVNGGGDPGAAPRRAVRIVKRGIRRSGHGIRPRRAPPLDAEYLSGDASPESERWWAATDERGERRDDRVPACHQRQAGPSSNVAVHRAQSNRPLPPERAAGLGPGDEVLVV